jgi:hypothetical protein
VGLTRISVIWRGKESEMQLKGAPAVNGEWECMECGYIEEGTELRRPAKCPECNATSDQFEFFSYDEEEEEWDEDELDDEDESDEDAEDDLDDLDDDYGDDFEDDDYDELDDER